MSHGEINATIYDSNYVSIVTAPDEKAGRLLNTVMCVAILTGPNVKAK